MRDAPGFRLYMPVLSRLADYMPVGKWVRFRCPLTDRHKNQDSNYSGLLWIGDRGELVCRCLGCGAGWREIQDWVGLPASAWWPQPLRRVPVANKLRSVAVAEYPYHDAEGQIVAIKTRWEPGFDGVRRKDFTWRRPLPQVYRARLGVPETASAWVRGLGAGKYVHQIRTDGSWLFTEAGQGVEASVELPATDPGIYRLPEVKAEGSDRPIVVVEGEGKADLIRSLGLTCTSGPAGASKWDPEWGSVFFGKRVCIIPDLNLNNVGVRWGLQVAVSALSWGAAAIRVVTLSSAMLPENVMEGDIGDILKACPAKDRLKKLSEIVRSCPEYRRDQQGES